MLGSALLNRRMSEQIQKDWMDERNRSSTLYEDGVRHFVLFAQTKLGGSACPCPCKICRNRFRLTYEVVEDHLIANGIDLSYRVWVLHGERRSKTLMEHPVVGNMNKENTEEEGLGIGDFVDAYMGCHGTEIGDIEPPFVPEADLGKRYLDYKKKAKEKLYPSCEGPETTLSAVVELHNLKKQFGWSGNSVTALLSMLRRWLPKGNTLPVKYPVMKQMLKDLGMKANCIHACENNCMLYWKLDENLMECRHCNKPRYKVIAGKGGKVSKEPNKVLRHFPLIPRLQRLYTIPWIAREMTWHARSESSWDYMRHPSDSGQWKVCKENYKEFANEERNVWLAIATDGFNPRGVQSTGYSCWPVITVPYNLPPSLCMKAEFQMLSLLIPGPKAPSQDIDVFLEPLYDELKQLWDRGVPAYDMYKKEHFSLRAMLMWGIHDFPAFGNLSGCVTHGYKACPACGDNTPSLLLPVSKKIVYTNYRQFLKSDHPFRDGKYLGLKTVEDNLPPESLRGEKLLQHLDRINFVSWKDSNGKRKRAEVNVDGDGSEVTVAWYKKSILFGLGYWINHKVRHVIDVMHTEKNVAEHLLNTILCLSKTKDTGNAREDMRLLGIHSGQWMQIDSNTGKTVKPHASFVLDKNEKMDFLKTLKYLKLPSGFSSNLSNIVSLNPPGLLTMKSHDYHVIMEYLLPVLLQHAFPKHRDLRKAIHQISLFFNLLCSKVLIRNDIQEAKFMVVEALCVLEKHFPPSFFDISIHLVVHLADEALLCGPTQDRWMYPFER